MGGKTLADALMEPTSIYVQPLLALYGEVDVHAVAHITGGGLVGFGSTNDMQDSGSVIFVNASCGFLNQLIFKFVLDELTKFAVDSQDLTWMSMCGTSA